MNRFRSALNGALAAALATSTLIGAAPTVTAAPAGPAVFALDLVPGDIGGTVWLGFNGDTTFDEGDNFISPFADILPPSVVEKPYEGASVRLLDAAGNVVAGPIATDVLGEYVFRGVGDGTFTVEVTAPDNFEFVSAVPAGDSDVLAPAPVGNDPYIGTATVVLAGDSAEIDAGLSPIPTLTVAYVDLDGDPNNGVQSVDTGKDPFDVGCPGPGLDCAKDDDVVRSNDLVTFNLGVQATNLATGGAVDDVIVEIKLNPTGDADLGFVSSSATGLPTPCIGNGPPDSVITEDPVTGVVTLACNIGPLGNGLALLPISVLPSGSSPNGSSFTWDVQTYSAADQAIPSDVLPGGPIDIVSVPKFDLTKNNDASNPFNSLVPFAALQNRVNEVTGETELGKTHSYDVSIVLPAGTDNRGIESLGDSFTFTDQVDPRYAPFGARVVNCLSNPYRGTTTSRLPGDGNGARPFVDSRTADNGAWSCTPEGEITVTGADTSGEHLPATGAGGNSLGALGVIVTGSVQVWVPASAFFRYAGPDGIINTADDGTTDGTTPAAGTDPADWGALWQYGDEAGTGTFPMTNCLGDFDPDSATGQSNLGAELESGWDGTTATGNNCRNHSFTIASGNWSKKYGGNQDLSGAPGNVYWTGREANIVPGQTAQSTGDGPVVAGQSFFGQNLRTNQGNLGALRGVGMCETIDNSTYRVLPITAGLKAGEYSYATIDDKTPANYSGPGGSMDATDNGWIIEYARFTDASGRETWNNDYNQAGPADPIDGSLPVATPDMDAAAADCGAALTAAGNLEWSSDPAWAADDIVMARLVGDPDYDATTNVDEDIAAGDLAANDNLWWNINFEARREFYAPGAAIDGTRVLAGTLLPNHANLMYDWNAAEGIDGPHTFGPGGYDPSTHTGTRGATTTGYGDRLIFRDVTISIQKTADAAAPTDDLVQESFAGDPILWSLTPSVSDITGLGVARSVQVTDVLPQFLSYDPSCTPDLPAGIAGPSIELDTPAVGQTTLVWTLGDRPANIAIDPIVMCTVSSQFTPAPVDVLNSTTVTADGPEPDTDDRGVRILQVGRLAVEKEVDFSLDELDDDQVWTLTWGNTTDSTSPITFAPVDMIDVLPFVGDDAGPAQRIRFASDYAGTLQLTGAMPAPTRQSNTGALSPEVGTWYYTADASETVNHDAHDAENILATGTANWCTWDGTDFVQASGVGACPTDFAAVTAIRFVSDTTLPFATSVSAELTLQATDNERGDFYVNRFGAFTSTFPDDAVLSNEPFVQVISFSVGDLLWFDADNDGVFLDGTDVVLADGTQVDLYNAGDVVGVATPVGTTTVVDGRWIIEGLADGDYFVNVPTIPAGFGPALNAAPADDDINEGGDHSANAAGAGLTTDVFTLSYSEVSPDRFVGDEPRGENVAGIGDPLIPDALTNLTIDLAITGTGSLGDRVWVDDNADGVQDPGEPGINAVTVTATWAGFDGVFGTDDDVVYTDVTEGNGDYLIESLPPGDYTVAVTGLDDDFAPTFDLDSDIADPDRTTAVTLAPGQNREDVDFGENVTFTLGDRVWIDLDDDGVFTDGTDIAVPDGTTIELLDADGEVVQTSTVADGMYLFDGLLAGDYSVRIPTSALIDLLSGSAAAPGGVIDPNDDVDDDADHNAADGDGGIVSGVITLSATLTPETGQIAGDEPDAFTNSTLDLAIALAPPGVTIDKEVCPAGESCEPAATVGEGGWAESATFPLLSTVTWRITITNLGPEDLVGVAVSDVLEADCDAVIGDLAVGESAQYTCETTGIAVSVDPNTATVTATGSVSGTVVTDDDPASALVPDPDPALSIIKSVNSEDANEAPGVDAELGSTLEFTYDVRIEGNVALVDVAVTDDKIAPEDIVCVYGDDADDNVIAGPIAVGETFSCTATAVAIEGQYTNIGTASGTPATGGDAVVADDPANVFGLTPVPPPTTQPAPPPTTLPEPPAPSTTITTPVIPPTGVLPDTGGGITIIMSTIAALIALAGLTFFVAGRRRCDAEVT